MNNYQIYCLNYNNLERRNAMENKFKQSNLNYSFYEGVSFSDQRLNNFSDKKTASCCYGHLDMIKMFSESDYEFGIFCEDDILIHKELSNYLSVIFNDIKINNFETVLIGYLLSSDEIKSFKNLIDSLSNDIKYHDFFGTVWGAQMYILTKEKAKYFVDKYNQSYITQMKTPFSADWIFTREGKRVISIPILAIEDGKTNYDHPGQRYYHDLCYRSNYNENFI